jgi:hypothetical protein
MKSLKKTIFSQQNLQIASINVSLVKHEQGIRGLSHFYVTSRRKYTPFCFIKLKLFLQSSAFPTFPSSQFSIPREERQ